MHIEYRVAEMADVPAIEALIPTSARGLKAGYYTAGQVEGALGTIFGVDTQLIKDGTYFVAVADKRIVGCGGWSKRVTEYGSDAAKKDEDRLRNPKSEPAMIRAFFVHPEYSRKGIGREILRLSETGARDAGFVNIEIVATLPGEPLYTACGYGVVERFTIDLPKGEHLPVVRMRYGKTPNKAPASVLIRQD